MQEERLALMAEHGAACAGGDCEGSSSVRDHDFYHKYSRFRQFNPALAEMSEAGTWDGSHTAPRPHAETASLDNGGCSTGLCGDSCCWGRATIG